MNISRTTIASYVGFVFASGAVLGAVGHRLYVASAVSANLVPAMKQWRSNPSVEEYRKRALTEYQSRLKLSDDQVSKLNEILDETRAQVVEIRKQMHPKFEQIHQEQTAKVKSLLKPSQQIEYDKILKERKDHQGKSSSRGPG